jgi:hypothetical protein
MTSLQVRAALAAALVAWAAVPGASRTAAAQEPALIDALVKNAPIPAATMPTDPVGKFQAEVVNLAVPAARALRVQFQPDGAQSLLEYIGSGPVVDALKTPAGRPEPAVIARNEQRFVALALAHSEESATGLLFTKTSVDKLKATVRQAQGWFCPCWPFCK